MFKQRKLQIDPSENVWYVLEQYGKRTQQNVGMHIDNGPPPVMHHSRCSVANIK